jgi:hypothetical protein
MTAVASPLLMGVVNKMRCGNRKNTLAKQPGAHPQTNHLFASVI